MLRRTVLVLCLIALLCALGCGGTGKTSSPGISGNPPGSSNPPGTGGGGGSSAAIQYAAETNDRTSGATGQLTIDVNGQGTLTMHSAGSNNRVTLSWCNY